MKKILIVTDYFLNEGVDIELKLKQHFPDYEKTTRSFGEVTDEDIKDIGKGYWDIVILWKPALILISPPMFLGWFRNQDTFNSICVSEDIDILGISFAAGITSCISPNTFFNNKMIFESDANQNFRLLG